MHMYVTNIFNYSGAIPWFSSTTKEWMDICGLEGKKPAVHYLRKKKRTSMKILVTSIPLTEQLS